MDNIEKQKSLEGILDSTNGALKVAACMENPVRIAVAWALRETNKTWDLSMEQRAHIEIRTRAFAKSGNRKFEDYEALKDTFIKEFTAQG